MTFREYIRNLNSRLNSEPSQELSMLMGSLICYLVKTIEDFIKERASVFQSRLGLSFISEKEPEGKVCYLNNPEVRSDYKFSFSSFDLLDYIYALLHSPSYKEKYKDFARKDFNWILYPKDSETFWMLVELGGELRRIHLLESPKVEQHSIRFPVNGNNRVENVRFKLYDYEQEYSGDKFPDYLGAVFINDVQCFADVPVATWELYIGEHQPAQKWLNDRKGSKLGGADVKFYQGIIVSLTETFRLIREIKKIGIE